jgi:hypothetical protein
MAGVDYEDDRRPDPSLMPSAAGSSRAAQLVREVRAVERITEVKDRAKHTVGGGRDANFAQLEEEQLSEEPKKRRKENKQQVRRDRLSVDKDAPELVRVRSWITDEDTEDEDPDREDSTLDELEISDGGEPRESRAHLFEHNQRPEPGDLSLRDPDEIARVLGSPLAYAKHVMILTEAFRRTTGATRGEAIDYLARMFIACSDKTFGRLAMKEFGPSSGILDIYPLEVIEHVLERYAAFLPKVGFGTLFRAVRDPDDETIYTDTRTPIVLDYQPDLKIRAFAVSGGGRPGYLFEPDQTQGKYRLWIYTSGKYRILISAINETGYTTIERLRVLVRPRAVEDLGINDANAVYPERDEEKVRAWVVPEVGPIPEDLSEFDHAALEDAVEEELKDDTLTEIPALTDSGDDDVVGSDEDF